MSEFKVFANPEDVAQATADFLVLKIQECIDINGLCHVVLPGGNTPARCLEIVAESKLQWNDIHWYLSDERCFPVGHENRNDTMVLNKLFLYSSLSSQFQSSIKNFHAIPAELGPEQGAKQYTDCLDSIERINIALLGMGEDGHTASLFPGNAALLDSRKAVPVYDAPKPPLERVSLGLNVLKDVDYCIVMATGENKYNALMRLQAGEDLPVAQVSPDIFFVDEKAMNINKKINSNE